MGTNTFRQGSLAIRRAYSPHLVGYWKCNEGSGNYIKDYSGNGLDLSPLNAPKWKPGLVANCNCTPTVDNGFYYENGNLHSGITGTTEPSWPVIAGNTVVDGTVTWTCRAVPTSDMWGGTALYLRNTGAYQQQLFPRGGGLHPAVRELITPTPDGNISYSSNGTISATLSGNHIDDTASGFPLFSVGDWIQISGFTGNTDNNTMAKVSASSINQISFSIGGVNLGDTATGGEIVTIRKILPPPAMLFCCNLSTTSTTLGYYLAEVIAAYGSGFRRRIGFTTTRRSALEMVNVVAQSSNPLGQNSYIPNGSAVHFAMLVDFEAGTYQTFKNGVRDSVGAGALPIRMYTVCSAGNFLSSAPTLTLFRAILPDGVTEVNQMQLYVGRSPPAGLTGATPALYTQLAANTPLSNTDWP